MNMLVPLYWVTIYFAAGVMFGYHLGSEYTFKSSL